MRVDLWTRSPLLVCGDVAVDVEIAEAPGPERLVRDVRGAIVVGLTSSEDEE